MNVDPAAGSFMFCDNKASIGPPFNDWEPNICKVRDCLPFKLTVSARTLRSAFNNVSGDGPSRHPVPVIPRPPELVNQGRQGQAGICGPAGSYNLGSAIPCLRPRPRPKIYVCTLNSISYR